MKVWQKYVLFAAKRGYRVTSRGVVLSYTRKPLKLRRGRYPTFGLRVDGRSVSIPAHKFAAFCFYGRKSFSAPCTRHRNGNVWDLSRTNIRIGTYSQNAQDIPAEVRLRSALAASRVSHMHAARVGSDGRKRCTRCRRRRAVSRFGSCPANTKSGLHSWCRTCRAEADRKRRSR